jgi:hypothetical protein
MSQQDAARAVHGLRDVVLADPELREIARKATTPEDLEALWQSPRFREVHEELVKGVSEEDVRSYVAELSDEQLDDVSGGILIGLSQPSVQNLSPRGAYLTALGGALKQGLSQAIIPCV